MYIYLDDVSSLVLCNSCEVEMHVYLKMNQIIFLLVSNKVGA